MTSYVYAYILTISVTLTLTLTDAMHQLPIQTLLPTLLFIPSTCMLQELRMQSSTKFSTSYWRILMF